MTERFTVGPRYVCEKHGDIGPASGRYPAQVLRLPVSRNDETVLCLYCYAEDLASRLPKVARVLSRTAECEKDA